MGLSLAVQESMVANTTSPNVRLSMATTGRMSHSINTVPAQVSGDGIRSHCIILGANTNESQSPQQKTTQSAIFNNNHQQKPQENQPTGGDEDITNQQESYEAIRLQAHL